MRADFRPELDPVDQQQSLNHPLAPNASLDRRDLLSSGMEAMALNRTAAGHSGGAESASSSWDAGSFSSAVDSAFKGAMNGQGDYGFVSDKLTTR